MGNEGVVKVTIALDKVVKAFGADDSRSHHSINGLLQAIELEILFKSFFAKKQHGVTGDLDRGSRTGNRFAVTVNSG
jgi:hypothetical protein